MLEDLRVAFGLRDEDEVVAVFITFLIAFAALFFFLRGCAPVEQLLDVDGVAPIVESDALPIADLARVDRIDSDGSVTFVGTYLPNSQVDIVVDGETVGRTRTDGSGNWRFPYQLDRRGAHTLGVIGLAGGALGSRSIDYPFTWRGSEIVAADPERSTIIRSDNRDGANDAQRPVAVGPALSVVSATQVEGDPNTWLLEGTGAPNRPVTLSRAGTVLATAAAGASGAWSSQITLDQTGRLNVDVEQGLANGDVLSDSASIYIEPPVVIDPVVPVEDPEPTATTEPDPTATAEPTAAPTATPEPEPTATAEPTATPEPEPTATPEPTEEPEPTAEPSPFAATFDEPEVTPLESGDESRVVAVVSGEGPAGGTVRITLGNSTLDEVTIAEDGTWQYEADLTLTPEVYRLGAALLDANGNVIEEGADSLEIVIEAAEEASTDEDANDGDAAEGSGLFEVVFASESASLGQDADVVTLDGGAPVVELILDASWSMRVALDADDTSRIGIAKRALRDVVNNTLPEGVPVAYRAFGNVEGNYACRTDLMLPLEPLDRETLLGEIERTDPIWNANTPIAASLAAVPTDLAGVTGPITIVLLTDGEETCDGDPAAEITKLRESGIDVRVNIVGLALDDDALKEEFARWAELGGGTYIDVSANSNELAAALDQSMQTPFEVVDSAGNVAGRGTVGGAPLRLDAGDYTLRIGSAETPITVTADGSTVIEAGG